MKSIFVFLIFFFFLPFFAYAIGLRLTGDRIPPSFIEERLNETVKSLYGPDANLQPIQLSFLYPYQKKDVAFSLHLGKEKVIPLHLIVTDEEIPNVGPPLLLFSDHPEILTENGLLFSAGIIFFAICSPQLLS